MRSYRVLHRDHVVTLGKVSPPAPRVTKRRPADPDLLPLADVAAAIGHTPRRTKALLRKHGLPIGGTRKHRLVNRRTFEALKLALAPIPDILYSPANEAERAATRGRNDGGSATADSPTARAHASGASRAAGDHEHHRREVGAERNRHRRRGRPLNSVARVLRARQNQKGD
jgi:hypothetical protein